VAAYPFVPVSDPRDGESSPGKHESCPIPAAFHEKLRVAIRQAKGPRVDVFDVRDREMRSFPQRHGAGQLNRDYMTGPDIDAPPEGRRTI
jgi:hypothetical protein